MTKEIPSPKPETNPNDRSGDDRTGKRIRAWEWVIAGGALLVTGTVLGFLGSFWWFFDLFSHFRVQYFVSLVVVALVAMIPRRVKAAGLFGAVALVNLGTILPLYFGKEPPPSSTSHAHRALLINVNTQAGNPESVARVIRETDADILVLEEISEAWLETLSDALKGYAHSKVAPREDNFGIGLFSKHAFTTSEVQELGESEVPTVIAEVDLPGGRVTVIATHPLPPGGSEYSRLRNDQLARLPDVVKQAKSPVLLLGDLNVTPWCSYFRRLLKDSGLKDSAQGRGVQPSWPAGIPILRIPLDHCLYSEGIQVTRREIGPDVGSDHYPLVVEFVVSAGR